MIYFDDSVLPLHGVTDEIGLNLAAHFYNSSIQLHGRNEAVMNAKMLNDMQREAMVYDIERGKARRHSAVAVADRHLHRLVALRPGRFSRSINTNPPRPSCGCSPTSSAKTATSC